jgi:hypothetical protein
MPVTTARPSCSRRLKRVNLCDVGRRGSPMCLPAYPITDHPMSRIDELLPWCWKENASAEARGSIIRRDYPPLVAERLPTYPPWPNCLPALLPASLTLTIPRQDGSRAARNGQVRQTNRSERGHGPPDKPLEMHWSSTIASQSALSIKTTSAATMRRLGWFCRGCVAHPCDLYFPARRAGVSKLSRSPIASLEAR